MTDRQFILCYAEADYYQDRDAYVSDLALSCIWSAEPEEDIPLERIEAIGQIWDIYHRSVKDIAAAAGLSQCELVERFCIPYHTAVNWYSGQSECPAYVRLMMQECLGLLKR